MNPPGTKKVLQWVIPFALFLIVITTLTICVGLYFALINQAKDSLAKTTSRIKEDLIIKDGIWDLSLYNADNNISDVNPLYIITSEGSIIERSRPIHGLLDLSRYTLISQYIEPTTVDTVTNESWRVLSTPILSGDQSIGIIYATYYKPNTTSYLEIDKQLQDAVAKIKNSITTSGDNIDISKVDTRQFPYTISFQIVSRFNKVIFQSNNVNSITRMPSAIDRSYIDNQLKGDRYKKVTDSQTKVKYLTLTTPLTNEKNLTSGIIVTAVPIESIDYVLKIFLILASFIGCLGLMLVIPFSLKLLKNLQASMQITKKNSSPKCISFEKKDSKLKIDEEVIDIPYASYQYYFCQAIFQKPQKKWEADELLEIFGEEFGPEKWRKVYDTMIALNKKTHHLVEKLFIVKNKRYSLNPQLLPAIQSSNS